MHKCIAQVERQCKVSVAPFPLNCLKHLGSLEQPSDVSLCELVQELPRARAMVEQLVLAEVSEHIPEIILRPRSKQLPLHWKSVATL